MKTNLWLAVGALFALALILFAVWADPMTGPKVDTAHRGYWVVVRHNGDFLEYLTYVNVSRTMVPDYRQDWTVFWQDAWKYGEASSAEADAKVSMGQARPLKGLM